MTGPAENADKNAVIEAPPHQAGPQLISHALSQRIHQQEILAQLGVIALQGASFDHLLAEAARLTAEGMRADFCKILEYLPDQRRLLVRAGVGWGPGVVGAATIGADLESPAGFALRTGEPVISNHLEAEERFATPRLLADYGIHRAMNVILQGDEKPFGVLEVDSQSEGAFVPHDLAFLQGAANILGMAIERERHERHLTAALDLQKVLLREVTHRVKNSLAMVASLLQLQASTVGHPELTRHLQNAANRVYAIANAHESIHQGTGSDRIDLGVYLKQVCKGLDETVANCTVSVDAPGGIEMTTDRAIPIALVANELITNAAKYAYDGRTGAIHVTLTQPDADSVQLTVRDEGAGLPKDFNAAKGGLGMRIIQAFAHQLKGKFEIRRRNPGTEFVMSIPITS